MTMKHLPSDDGLDVLIDALSTGDPSSAVEDLRFEDVCGYATTPWRITMQEWNDLCDGDWASHSKTFRLPRATMEQSFCLVRDRRWPQSEYAEYFEIRMPYARSSKMFGPYVHDAYRRGHRARVKALEYLIEHHAAELIEIAPSQTPDPDADKE